jgi:hypothetical protein
MHFLHPQRISCTLALLTIEASSLGEVSSHCDSAWVFVSEVASYTFHGHCYGTKFVFKSSLAMAFAVTLGIQIQLELDLRGPWEHFLTSSFCSLSDWMTCFVTDRDSCPGNVYLCHIFAGISVARSLSSRIRCELWHPWRDLRRSFSPLSYLDHIASSHHLGFSRSLDLFWIEHIVDTGWFEVFWRDFLEHLFSWVIGALGRVQTSSQSWVISHGQLIQCTVSTRPYSSFGFILPILLKRPHQVRRGINYSGTLLFLHPGLLNIRGIWLF